MDDDVVAHLIYRWAEIDQGLVSHRAFPLLRAFAPHVHSCPTHDNSAADAFPSLSPCTPASILMHDRQKVSIQVRQDTMHDIKRAAVMPA